MKASIYPSKLSGTVRAPASKSHFIRAVAAAMLAEGTSKIYNPSSCDDAKAMLNVAWEMGTEYKIEGDYLEIKGHPVFKGKKVFNCGESGLATRLTLGIASLFLEEVIICGTGTLLNRQLGDIIKPLQQLGVKCMLNKMKLPGILHGIAKGGQVVVDGSESSQFVSGLLMAMPLLKTDSELIVKNLKSRPYVDLTVETLKNFGIKIQNSEYRKFIINGTQSYIPTNLQVEGDWSGGAFLLAAAATSGGINVEGLDNSSTQADKAILKALESAGASITCDEKVISVKTRQLKAFTFDATHCPDLFPPLAVLATNCEGVSVIIGVGRLKHKESNRAEALIVELGKLGIKIEISEDEMYITGGLIKGGRMSSKDDHRMAMAGAVAALMAKGKVVIEQAECVSKSWPGFFKGLQLLGAKVDLEHK